MQFEEFLKRMPKLSNLTLLGQEAQFLMAPDERIRALKDIDIEAKNPRWAGVMAVFYPNGSGDTMLVLILRKTYKGVHSNQVGFPGGKVESFDASLEETALRETEEEIGVDRNTIEVIKKLTKIYIPPSNFWVQPYIGIVRSKPTFTKEEAEVEAILEVPLKEFLDDKKVIKQRIDTSYGTMLEVPAFYLAERVVWGATAMMLSEVKWALQQLD
ncbi:8-oxo-dGTP pyrophosphatase MutT (NUDIX family) [Leeuwenhoekiella aestuarii]|uniref:8-oxo-dGTP pyrophosphatase MutT (NUDIX family) n=1 Tax=Leeuwenhoekiella aestuarii TaxID=2249426 RepID=A0A4V1KPR7_9FLAO|nr:CoA pyrophosphatase [Leeuwenhoekiella aestuarii]RXG16342.1 8-oxo-dGTP pyrophosphatase MutT (NUDIX family) [Leeuwenhoekiella aestuarii]RXG17035.1 8-oxo-dGTP pyrophosphatase MutT (NUDIX family) [Leeuwenhoekiella aestuarii]